MGEGVDVPEHLGAQHRAKALAGPRRTVLADQRAAKAHQTQQHHHAAHAQHIAAVAIGDADVDDLRHDQGHDQLKDGLGQLENRADQHLFLKLF